MWKTLETADKSLLDMINQKDYNVTELFQEEKHPPKSPHEYVKRRSDRLETEAYYVQVGYMEEEEPGKWSTICTRKECG